MSLSQLETAVWEMNEWKEGEYFMGASGVDKRKVEKAYVSMFE